MFGFFFNRPLLLGMILFIGTLLGVVGYLNMPRNLYPDMERPQVTVITQLPGAAALTVAQKVSRPIEQEIYALSGVRDVQGTNKNEVSIVRAEFDYTKGLDGALVDVSNALSRVRGRLPPEALASSVYPVGGFTRPVLVIALSPQDGQGLNLHQIRLIAENDIKNRLVAQPKIANVEVFGGFEPALRIEFDPLKLAAHGLSASRLQEIVARLDRDAPLGVSQGGDASITLTLYGERSSAEALRRLPLAEGLTLGDVARVELSHAEQFSAFHGNGRPAIAVSVLRAPGGSVQEAIDEAESLLPSLKARYPGIRFEIADTQGEVIQISNANMLEALRDAIVFVSLVMLVFLANWRAVVTALISIPLVFLLTLAALWLLGQELNMIVMTGIILSLGMLVDDAVVVLENIERHLSELKEGAATAVRTGTEEVLFPVFLGTLATAAVLVPLLFVGEFAALMFSHMVRTVLIAVVVSYFLSVTLIPQISRYWYRNGVPPRSRWESAIERTYQRLIQSRAGIYVGLLHYAASGGGLRRLLLLSPAVLLLLVSVAVVMPVIGQDAMPPMDSGVVRMHVKFGGNVPVQAAEERMAEFERELMTDRRLKRFSASYGSEPGVLSLGSGQMPGEVTYNLGYVTRDEREAGSADIEAELRAKVQRVPGAVVAEAYDFGTTVLSTVKAPVNIRLFAEDWRQLPPAAADAERALRTVPGFTTVAAGWDMLSQEAVLVLDEEKLRSHGLTPDQIAAQLPLKGGATASLSKLPGAASIPVRLYFAEPYRSRPQALLLLPIPLADGNSLALGEVARLVHQPSAPLITSDALQYTLDLYAYRDQRPISHLLAGSQQALEGVLPAGVRYQDFGDNGEGGDSSRRMMIGLGMGVLVLFGVLAPAYGSVGLALLSIGILPLSAIGAVWGLIVFDKAMCMPAIMGVILLFSIVIKNSILMVEFIQTRRRAGAGTREAAEEAIRLRYRPILMTAAATIAGLIPIALEHAVGLERLSPLADAAIGGLLVGTALSLFYLPMCYVWVTQGRPT